MRTNRALLVAVATLTVLAALALPPHVGPARAVADGRAWLPAPVTVQTSAGTFEIERTGRVARISPRVFPYPRGAGVFPSGVWYVIRDGHLEVGRGARELWRSRARFPATFKIGVVTIGANAVAFSYRRGGSEDLYLATLGRQPERRLARGEFPLGWTSGGFFTYRYRGRDLRFRTNTGALAATVAERVRSYAYQPTTQSLYFVDHKELLSADGGTARPLESLAALGLRPRPFPAVIPAGGLVELLGSDRLTLLWPDGSVFAEARIELSRANISSSSIALAPDKTAVAYTVLAGRQASAGVETVYMLRAGTRAATALFRQRIDTGGCERGAGVQWHGRWILYRASEGYLVVVDSTGRQRAIELSPVVRRLRGYQSAVSAYWTGQEPAL